jgi:hypothetical protein
MVVKIVSYTADREGHVYSLGSKIAVVEHFLFVFLHFYTGI